MEEPGKSESQSGAGTAEAAGQRTEFITPVKRISDAEGLVEFQKSEAFRRIQDLISKLSLAVSLKKIPSSSSNEAVNRIITLLDTLVRLIDETPPSTGPRRFGNVSFREWHRKLDAEGPKLIRNHLSKQCLSKGADIELVPYFLGAFGSGQRLDFGTGHELSFLAFVGGLLYTEELGDPTGEDLLLLFDRYFKVVQKLVETYTLEPAGSKGVWGLDDHFHIPYILGSAQIVDITKPDAPTPSLPPKSVLDKQIVKEQAPVNLYFSAIAFIYKVKHGHFHEHSPILYDVTGVTTWHKIHRGMIKMYLAEVLGKFPVVQHFVFGSLFPFEPAH
uniref:Serine/threonine-protein phosphatase 2A activator n=1 Tax=Blastobotrys adeninivorans TaxID=409370 RepID=A0A060T902_BLAAD